MQQTDKYKLNKPDQDDPIAIAPLNENMDKVEGALVAEAEARQTGDAALDQRLQVLELKKVVAGYYTGDGCETQFIHLGFTPIAVLIHTQNMHGGRSALSVAGCFAINGSAPSLNLVEGGFEVTNKYEHSSNYASTTFTYIAFG